MQITFSIIKAKRQTQHVHAIYGYLKRNKIIPVIVILSFLNETNAVRSLNYLNI